MFDQIQEEKIVEHFKTMAALGYGYTQQECVDDATIYAVKLGIHTLDNPLIIRWMRSS